MKKYAFLVHHSDYEAFLTGVRDVGVLHVQPRNADPTQEAGRMKLLQKEVSEIIAQLKRRKVKTEEGTIGNGDIEGLMVVRSVLDLNADLENTRRELATLNKEIGQMEPWGNFSPAMVAKLEQEAGLDLHFFFCPQKKFKPAWETQHVLEVIKNDPPDCYFVVFARKGETVEISAERLPDPTCSLPELLEKKAVLETTIEAINGQLDTHAAQHLPALEKALKAIEEEKELSEVQGHTALEADEKLMVLEGFVPEPKEAELMAFCDKMDIVCHAEKPSPKDEPPVLLKNNSFASLFEPIGKLFALPSYVELDLTPFFAPFFMLFFGLCLGDAGYGIVVLVGATLYKRKAKPAIRPILTLAQWLGLSTILFGIVTATFFGVGLLEEKYAWLGAIRNFMLSGDQVFQLALILGAVQILFGLGVQAANNARQFGAKYALKPIGWILLLLSITDIAMLKLATPYSTWMAWAGVGILLLFNDPDASLLGRLGKGVWELYGITGFFGDLLSYIRLFALGISSAILGFVINDVSLRMLDIPYAGPVLFVLLLVVGHSANLMLACLGSFVHPLRLTFVEFYKNAGFAGGGKAYKPFAKKT